jgi:hypothetical protein
MNRVIAQFICITRAQSGFASAAVIIYGLLI